MSKPRGPVAVESCGFGDCYYAPSHIPHDFVVRLDNKIHFSCYRVKIYKNNPPPKKKNSIRIGGRLRGSAMVLDRPLIIDNFIHRIRGSDTHSYSCVVQGSVLLHGHG